MDWIGWDLCYFGFFGLASRLFCKNCCIGVCGLVQVEVEGCPLTVFCECLPKYSGVRSTASEKNWGGPLLLLMIRFCKVTSGLVDNGSNGKGLEASAFCSAELSVFLMRCSKNHSENHRVLDPVALILQSLLVEILLWCSILAPFWPKTGPFVLNLMGSVRCTLGNSEWCQPSLLQFLVFR